MDDIDRVLAIARRYEVRVFLHPDFPHGYGELEHEDKNRRGLHVRALTKTASDGPRWHWCDVKQGIVWFDNFDPVEVQTHLHELCHVITQPPGGDIEQLSEDVVLMPFERTLARQCLSPLGYRRVINWQLNTQIEWWDAQQREYHGSLEDVPNYERRAYWRESFAGLRRMGAIKNGRVTWKRPNWARAPKALLARGNLTGR